MHIIYEVENSNVGSSRGPASLKTVEVELLRSCNVVHGDISGSNCCMDDAHVARLVEAWIALYSFEPIGSYLKLMFMPPVSCFSPQQGQGKIFCQIMPSNKSRMVGT